MIKDIKYAAMLVAISAPVAIQAQSVRSGDDAGPLDQVVPVADEALDTTVPSMATDDLRTLDQRLADEFDRYRRLISDGAIDEADRSAKLIVEMVIKLHGPRSLETSKALNNLAIVQHRNGQFDAAIQNFETAVEIIEDREDRLNERLVNPLKGLGAAQLGNGRPDLAAATFNRATHITHVNEGPHNIEQVELLESLAQSTLSLGDTKAARDILDRIHVLNVRHFEGDSLALIPSLLRRASWQHAARYYNDERATYRRAIRIVESQLGKNSPELIVPLNKLGESFYFVDLSQTNPQQQGLVSTGELYFKRAAKIAEAAPNIEWRQVADAKLALADHYIFVESHNRARKIYNEVWNFLSSDDERVAGRDELLGRPITLAERELPKYVKGNEAGSSNDALLKGTIRVDYTVSPRGRVRNIRTEAQPQEFTDMQRIVHREIRRRVFRPRMVDGQLRESEPIIFEHTFFYRQADLDKLTKQQDSAQTPAPADDSSTT